MPVADLLKENGDGDKPFPSPSSSRFALRKLNNLDPRISRQPLIYLLFEVLNGVAGECLNLVVLHRTANIQCRRSRFKLGHYRAPK
jgi:hypothetical protein